MPGSHRCFCSSEPKRWIAYMAREPWTETRERMPESAASSSRQARPYWTALAPAQPYPFRDMPSAPSEPSSRASSRMPGSSPFSYHSAMCGRTRSAAQVRTVSRIARSSGSRRSSMPRGSPGSNTGGFDGFADSVVDMRCLRRLAGGAETRHGTKTSSGSYGALPTLRLSVPPVQSPLPRRVHAGREGRRRAPGPPAPGPAGPPCEARNPRFRTPWPAPARRPAPAP